MGLAKSKRIISNLLQPNRYVYCHIPKCGGSSLRLALRRRLFFDKAEVEVGESYSSIKLLHGIDDQRAALAQAAELRTAMMAYYLDRGTKYVAGHCPLDPVIIQQHTDVRFITLLRNPVDRFISHYFYSKDSGKHGNIDLELAAFLDTPRARDFGALYLRYLSRQRWEQPDVDLSLAKQSLDMMAAVGFTDDMQGFESQLKTLGLSLNVGHENAGIKQSKRQLSWELRQKIESLCSIDMELYRYAEDSFRSH
ncbi:sulfotransferase family 2 domain-containing protein [Aliagarivorans marinus]|uniref:sulfotransferase family 2 domain-containing protein n=1 Tax=Aliagarivorans marinus TaxID=561965 RepID=UPI000401CD08|nr:sulfotransferase family 2 domain-containing protein [Aliagarivorans marinus]